jgi:GntR family transcriptional regulator
VAPIELMSNEDKIEKELKPQFLQLLQEAIYLGLTKEELLNWFEEAKEGGGFE